MVQVYESNNLMLSGKAQLTQLYAEPAINNAGVEGIQVYVDSDPVTNQFLNYRLTYEETYKIIVPFWQEDDFVLTNYDGCALPEPTYDLEILPRDIQNQVCYATVDQKQ